MPDDTAGEKILPPSPRKLQRAREEGNVARSSDLSATAGLLVGLLAMVMLAPLMFNELLNATAYYFGNASWFTVDITTIQWLTMTTAYFMGFATVPFMAVMLITGILINILQVGPLFAGKALQPKFSRINPIAGIKRLFSLRALVELIKSILKTTIILVIVYFTMRNQWEAFIVLMELTPQAILRVVSELVVDIWWRVALAMLALAGLDLAYQRWQFMQDQRMTRRESSDEAKELEGDPRIKQRVRQLQRQMATQRMLAEVPEAEVIVTNPTHYAVALRYDEDNMDAPVVVAKGARLVAERIRDIAIENNVPIVQRPDLARTLYSTAEVGDTIPESMFRAVAEVLAYVYQIDQRAAKRRKRQNVMRAAEHAV